MSQQSIIKQKGFRFALLALVLVAGASAFSSPGQHQHQHVHQSMATSKAKPSRALKTSLSMSAVAAPMLPEGLVKTVVQGGSPSEPAIRRGDVVTVKYTCYSTKGESDNILLARSDSLKMIVGDGSMVPGWDAALRSMSLGERAVIRITDPALGYGSESRASASLKALGANPEDQLEFDIKVEKVQTAAQVASVSDMDFDAMVLQDNIPKTAQEIAEAYNVKMSNKAPDKEGLEGWIETVQNYYFFGFFEGETGEEAPWYLKPSITFPIAFAIVGAAFWVSLGVGAISEKGAQSIDELDVIVTSFLSTATGL